MFDTLIALYFVGVIVMLGVMAATSKEDRAELGTGDIIGMCVCSWFSIGVLLGLTMDKIDNKKEDEE